MNKHPKKDKFFNNRIADKWLSIHEASAYLSITANALRIMVSRGKVKAYRLGQRLRFRREDLDEVVSPLTGE